MNTELVDYLKLIADGLPIAEIEDTAEELVHLSKVTEKNKVDYWRMLTDCYGWQEHQALRVADILYP